MYEVTWITWEICERSWCQCMSMHWRSFVFRSLSSLLSVSVIVSWLFSLFKFSHTKAQVWVSVHSHLHVSCVRWALLLIFSTPFTWIPSSWFLWSPCCSYCPTPSTSLISWVNTIDILVENDLPTKCVDRYTSRVIFLIHFYTSSGVHITLLDSKRASNVFVCALHSMFMSSMMCAWAFVVRLSVFVLLVPLRRFLLLFHTLLALWQALPLQC